MEVIAGNQPVATCGIKTRKITCTTNIVSRDGLFEISPIHAEQFCQVRERIATHRWNFRTDCTLIVRNF